ncbi:PID-CTERM protein-sorting domain-containing protein [Lutibacter agarilyticus]|uniref:PID-CTERM protein-sorting domain-containing protein n=1 Tax=Lutibacter agarilyticus TaxID=1109740 RepID=UPI000B78EEA3|nr:hypothetical protein [Lutibacter agarilyticus]
MNIKINSVLLSLFFMLFTFVAYAKDPPLPGPPPPPGNPIDGGLSFLIISGVAFGVYKLRKKS